MNVSEYKQALAADPEATNDGTWYARSTVQHNGVSYTAGRKLPSDLKNSEVLALLDVNALTSVAPAQEEAFAAPAHNGAPNQQGFAEDGVAHGNLQSSEGQVTDEQIAAAAGTQDGEGSGQGGQQ